VTYNFFDMRTLGRRLTTDFRSDLTGRKSIWSYVGHIFINVVSQRWYQTGLLK
jgi:hypothetical protein